MRKCLVLGSALAILATTASLDVSASGVAERELVIDVTDDGAPIDRDLVGFNWRDGGGVLSSLSPAMLRMWSVDFSRITSAPGRYDWSLPDQHVADIRATGAVPMIVLIGRPAWASTAGSAGYEEAVAAAVRRYGVEQVPDGEPGAIFEAGNEPEFYPTAHGQLPWEMPLDVAAQARAVSKVEAESGKALYWGGPGALFADPPVLEAFARTAASAGRPADFLSFHHYTNYPFLGPDGAEHADPAAAPLYLALARRNPAASPDVIGHSVSVARSIASAHRTRFGAAPEVVVSEWNLSAGGFDQRHDTHEAAAHAAAGLIELHENGADAAQFFAATDRHCPQPENAPDPLCGDWGTATADGIRKPVWFAFELWQRLSGRTVSASLEPGSTPEDTWVVATRQGNRLRVLVASFSVSAPRDQLLRLVMPSLELGRITVRTIGPSTEEGEGPVTRSQPGSEPVLLPANSVALLEATVRSGDSPTEATRPVGVEAAASAPS